MWLSSLSLCIRDTIGSGFLGFIGVSGWFNKRMAAAHLLMFRPVSVSLLPISRAHTSSGFFVFFFGARHSFDLSTIQTP